MFLRNDETNYIFNRYVRTFYALKWCAKFVLKSSCVENIWSVKTFQLVLLKIPRKPIRYVTHVCTNDLYYYYNYGNDYYEIAAFWINWQKDLPLFDI